MSRYQGFSKMGFTLSGRDALYLHGLTSLDDSVVFIESDSTKGMLRGVCVVPVSEDTQIINGIECSSLEKAMIDFMQYPYDDSGVIEASEMLDEQEVIRVVAYARDRHVEHLLRDPRWAEFYEDYLDKDKVPDSSGEQSFINIDIMFNPEMRQQAVASYSSILRGKLNLKLNLMDRRLKDLIDVLLGFRNFYPSGISKAEILKMVEDKDALEKAVSKQNFENCMHQANSFEPKSINGIKVEEFVSEFFSMLEGLTDESLNNNARFIDGYWEWA